jgi:SAM-dependent methyltransferase
MLPDLLRYMACPACGGNLVPRADERHGARILSGLLTCRECSRAFPIVRGVPRMNVEMDDLQDVARTFAFEWKAHHEGELERDTVFGRTIEEDWQLFLEGTGASDEDVRGAVVLDAGCGSGALTREIGRRGGDVVIGVDINDAVDDAYQHCADLDNVHIVQGNVFSLPLRERAFDLVWCNGVIHHTPDAAGGHRELSRFVRPGGTLYVWVYARRFNPFRFTKDIFDALRLSKLPPRALLTLAKGISYPSLVLLAIYRTARLVPGLRPRGAWGHRTVRPRTVRELQLTWFDALSPEYDSRHSEEEVISWFKREGFEQIAAIEEPKVGVRGVAPATSS